MDGIDVAVAELRLTDETIDLVPLGHAGVPYPTALRNALLAALPPGGCTAEELCRLDTEVGQAFAAAANDALGAIADGQADLVASLGQTLFHWVEDGHALGTMQIGQPAWIAEATGLPVVADLRARDVAAGGQGAPLASVLDRLWLREIRSQDRASDREICSQDRARNTAPAGSGVVAGLNIGGIANITVVTPDEPELAFDTGPGNALLDAAARMISNGAWQQDVDGDLAEQGRCRTDLLEIMLADAYYTAPPPKSTGKEHFHTDYLRAAMAKVPRVSGPDLLATLVELTATTVADACRAHGVTRVVASGGGMRNPTLRAALRRLLAPAELVGSDELGLPGDAKEAYLTALLGFLTWSGIPANAPSATGAKGPRLLGSITPGSAALRLPEPTTTTVTRLRVNQPAISGR
ncbi:MAG: anhydro-N-acetylmuramic acid kinase [Actinophytocola sp.]|uniref:anhydro-N-acetylmuramic acid kinase n=1 Tax=Actinophytocola sp. TaxID=1872138 RepID=UPI001320E8C0|nr:anhydro-N-acetylmuramic acid kinase [Actinophytocola sp.]MPZ80528.1 anhydro-N-acetylmuramic acid kinase [Actinophytocola sp.]